MITFTSTAPFGHGLMVCRMTSKLWARERRIGRRDERTAAAAVRPRSHRCFTGSPLCFERLIPNGIAAVHEAASLR